MSNLTKTLEKQFFLKKSYCGLCRAAKCKRAFVLILYYEKNLIDVCLLSFVVDNTDSDVSKTDNSDNDVNSIRQVLPTPSQIAVMTEEEAIQRLRSLLPDNILAEQLEVVSSSFLFFFLTVILGTFDTNPARLND